MPAVVTGATGHLGNNLVRALLERGQRVRAFVLPGDDLRPLAGLDVEIIYGDVRDPDALLQAFRGTELVYHLAGLISIVPGKADLLHQVNVVGTHNVVMACLRSGVRRLVHTASIHALVEPPHGETIDESRPFDPEHVHTDYGRSKAQAALEVLAGVGAGLDAVIVCPSGIIGPYDFQPSRTGQLFLDVARQRMPVFVHGAYDFVDVRDVALGQIAAGERGQKGQWYILSGEKVTVGQLMRCLEKATGIRTPRLGLPTGLARCVARLAGHYARLTRSRPLITTESVDILESNCCISHEKASRELGYDPRPVQETVTDTIHWFKESGILRTRPVWPKRFRYVLSPKALVQYH